MVIRLDKNIETDGNKPLSKADQDLDDLNNERADRDTGRMRRFLPKSSSKEAIRKKREREAELLSVLIRRLQDPEYAALYGETVDQLASAEAATEQALTDAIARGDQAEIDAIRRYQVDVLGHARDRMMDEDNPPSMEELEELQKQIASDMPHKVQEHIVPPPSTPSDSPAMASNSAIPDLSG